MRVLEAIRNQATVAGHIVATGGTTRLGIPGIAAGEREPVGSIGGGRVTCAVLCDIQAVEAALTTVDGAGRPVAGRPAPGVT